LPVLQEAKKPRSQEAKKPRSQEAKKLLDQRSARVQRVGFWLDEARELLAPVCAGLPMASIRLI
jgi:hypothetical protein